MSEQELVVLVVGVFALGLLVGMLLEARAWRRSAGDWRRRQSGGRLYVVREDSL